MASTPPSGVMETLHNEGKAVTIVEGETGHYLSTAETSSSYDEKKVAAVITGPSSNDFQAQKLAQPTSAAAVVTVPSNVKSTAEQRLAAKLAAFSAEVATTQPQPQPQETQSAMDLLSKQKQPFPKDASAMANSTAASYQHKMQSSAKPSKSLEASSLNSKHTFSASNDDDDDLLIMTGGGPANILTADQMTSSMRSNTRRSGTTPHFPSGQFRLCTKRDSVESNTDQSNTDQSIDVESQQEILESVDVHPGAYTVPVRAIGGMPVWARPPGNRRQRQQQNVANEENVPQQPDYSHLPPEMRPMQSASSDEADFEDAAQSNVPPEMRAIPTNEVSSNNSSSQLPPELRTVESGRAAVSQNNDSRFSEATTVMCSQFSMDEVSGLAQMAARSASTAEEIVQTNKPKALSIETEDGAEPNRKKCCLLAALFGVIVVIIVVVSISLSGRSKNNSTRNSIIDDEGAGQQPTTMAARTELQALLSEQSTLNIALWEDPDSAQSRALDWLVESESLETAQAVQNGEARRLEKRYVLATLFYSTGGQIKMWKQSCNFLSSAEVCDWNNAEDAAMQGVECDEENEIIKITLVNNGLKGALPDELGLLQELQVLQIEHNGLLEGTIPASIFALEKLSTLRLSNNFLGGSLPTNISASPIRHLVLSMNNLEGGLGMVAALSQLENLELAKNGFEGTIVFPNSAQRLEKIDLTGNNLEGTIPSDLENRMPNLKTFAVGENHFTGSFPWTTFPAEHLLHLDLHRNNELMGLPIEINRFQKLSTFNIVSNRAMSGNVPSEFGKLPDLEELQVSHSGITGQLPSSIGRLHKLKQFNVASTDIEGTIPQSFVNLKSIESLVFSHTRIIGSIDFLCDAFSDLNPEIVRCGTNVTCSCCFECF